ncbi:MAG: type II toxin-antitoxin system HipA family toxin [Betaproteobacteria bacterium]|nr:HipA domain-containing protein [Betaproteobacteria bacterium]MDE2359468.1 type II toxin-antitoxin system HipA family toxin [Betaproteobacteria bacterium]
MSFESSCFVYIQLPGTLRVVTCGRYALEGFDDGTFRGRFVYGRSYRDNPEAIELDPGELPLRAGLHETLELRGIFGALRDASPDAWGRRIIERELGRSDLTELDFLLHSPEDRVGALSFGLDAKSPAPWRKFNRTLDLPRLIAAAERLDADETSAERIQADDLLHLGTSVGGARPKAVVEDAGALWLAKFPQRDDRWNNAPVEAAMLRLAQLCGIRTPETQVVRIAGKDVLLVKRFDRAAVPDGYLRHRMLSALTLLRAGDDHTARASWSYPRIADELRRLVAEPTEALHEMFRRMVFNALISNTDDHPRNHAVIAPTRHWQLSPAYDLTPNPQVAQEQRHLALQIGAFNRYANRENLLSYCPRFRLERTAANAIIDDMKRIVGARWRELVRSAGGSERDCEAIASAFLYPGFEYDPNVVLGKA